MIQSDGTMFSALHYFVPSYPKKVMPEVDFEDAAAKHTVYMHHPAGLLSSNNAGVQMLNCHQGQSLHDLGLLALQIIFPVLAGPFAHLMMPAQQHGYAVLQGVIKACLHTDAAQRATAAEVARSPAAGIDIAPSK